MRIARTSRLLPAACVVFVLSLIAMACQTATPPAPSAPPYAPTATVQELMLSVIDPSADVVWNSVMAVMNEKGLIETKPVTDDDWTNVRHGAVTLMEAANLLMVPGRRVARPGVTSVVPGIELEPEEMDALIAKDRTAWEARAKALHDIMVKVVDAIDAKDADKVFELGEQIEVTCEGCHKQYWYPNEVIPELPPDPPAK
jgi:hypothetical protein